MNTRSRPLDPALTRRYMQNSLATESAQMQLIQDSARKNKITVALGFSENDHNSLYISQATISDTGEILMQRRKIMPTHMERTMFGNSTGNSLANVVPTAFGNVGQLACWEHVQPLLKYHTITQRETIHVAAWPPVFPTASENELWSMSREGEY
jgi:nitrilase